MMKNMVQELKNMSLQEMLTERMLKDEVLPETVSGCMRYMVEYENGVSAIPQNGGYYYPGVWDEVEGIWFSDLGRQDSMYHKETLSEHVAMVLGRMCRQCDRKAMDTDAIERFLIALLHDIGKKYVVAINARGGVCFYEHDRVSAAIANEILIRAMIPKMLREEIVSVIYYHMAIKNVNQCVLDQLEESPRIYELLQALDEADRGVTADAWSDREREDYFCGTMWLKQFGTIKEVCDLDGEKDD